MTLASNSTPLQSMRVLGHRLRVSVQTGSDPRARPLLMLMGLGGNIEMWEPLRTELANRVGMTTIAFDVPGTGGSSPPVIPLSLPVLGLMARQVLRSLRVNEVDVIGLSWGGLLAQQLAVTSPRAVRRLVLASTNMGWGSVPGQGRVMRTLLSRARYVSHRDMRDALETFGSAATASSEALQIHSEARLARPPSIRGYYSQLVGLLGWSSLPWLPLIRQPTLVVCGQADPAIPVINARVLAALLPNAKLAIVPGGHLVLFEQLATSVNLLAAFLDPARRGERGMSQDEVNKEVPPWSKP
jgi:pimeloyl-ACP methyl ester carboxylesterase